eukprot:2311306-Ditylum_brightwellii.AAC.1
MKYTVVDNRNWHCQHKIGIHAMFDDCYQWAVQITKEVMKDRLECTIKTVYHLKAQLLQSMAE